MSARSSKAEVKRRRQSRILYLYDQAKEENWENYAQELQKQLEVKELLKNINRIKQGDREKEDKINSI